MSPKEVLAGWRKWLQTDGCLLGMSAGMGLSAKVAHVAGIDFLTTSAADYYVMQGRGEGLDILPIGDANGRVLELTPEIISMAGETPVIAGVYANDTFRNMSAFLEELKSKGYTGVMNSPSMQEVDGYAKKVHDSVRINFEKELELLRAASEIGLLSAGVALSPERAADEAEAGVDIVIAKVVLSSEEEMLGRTERLKLVGERLQEMADAAHAKDPEMIVIAAGKAIENAEDLSDVFARISGLAGYLGQVTMEAYPVADAIREQIAAFKAAGAGTGCNQMIKEMGYGA